MASLPCTCMLLTFDEIHALRNTNCLQATKQLYNPASGKCLAALKTGGTLIVQLDFCTDSSLTRWEFDEVNET